MKGSVFDIFVVPLLVFSLIIMILLVLYVSEQFQNMGLNQSMSEEAQNSFALFFDVKEYLVNSLNIFSFAIVFFSIIGAGILAFTIRSHPVFFPLFLIFGAVMIFVSLILSEIIDTQFAQAPEFSNYFQDNGLGYILVLKENLPILVALSSGFILIALYFKPLGVS